jgi:hypothetical protein
VAASGWDAKKQPCENVFVCHTPTASIPQFKLTGCSDGFIGEGCEEDAKIGGGGAPQKLLLDNTRVRVNLVSFLKDFDRMGGLKRRNDQLLVYIDPGAYEITRSGDSGKEITPDPAKRKPLAPGSAVFHGRDSVVSSTHIYAPYRVIFLEVK